MSKPYNQRELKDFHSSPLPDERKATPVDTTAIKKRIQLDKASQIASQSPAGFGHLDPKKHELFNAAGKRIKASEDTLETARRMSRMPIKVK